METIGIRELRQHASKWLRRVRGGEAFEITDRGRPVARLVPVDQKSGLSLLFARGAATPATAELEELLAELGPPPSGPSPSDTLSALRADER